MKTSHCDDDTRVIQPSEKSVVRGRSQDWHTPVSHAADGTLFETAILDASKT